MSFLKSVERLLKGNLLYALAFVLAAKKKKVSLGAAPRILVVRLDHRVGNAILSLPLLDSLKACYPASAIDLLGHTKCRSLLEGQSSISTYLPFHKWGRAGGHGLFSTLRMVRSRGYDLVFDSGNPTDPSVTQAVLVRLCGSTYSVGPAWEPYDRLYTSAVQIDPEKLHEIELRMELLKAVDGEIRVEQPKLVLQRLTAKLPFPSDTKEKYVVVHIGSRLESKTLTAELYGEVIRLCANQGLGCVLTYGGEHQELAISIGATQPGVTVAPLLDLVQLGHVIQNSLALVVADTGPMHMGVALGTPTCGIFVSTDPNRYGYADVPHLCLNLKEMPSGNVCLKKIDIWLRQTASGSLSEPF